jgi:molybdenum ABC transporter molybdate-binding protein
VSTEQKLFAFSIFAAAVLVVLLVVRPREAGRAADRPPLILYCAAGLKPPVERVAAEYERAYGVRLQLQYGGSGTLLSNLRVAGVGDLFLAADQSYLETARSNRLVAEVIPLARLTPVIAVRKGNPRQVRGLADLLRPDVAVALANPDAAAVGRVCRRLLQHSGQWAELEKRAKVFKPTVTDVANDIKLGTVDAGVVWDATVAQYPELEAVRVEPLASGEQLVAVGVLSFSRQPAGALRFARYLGARDKGLLELARAGYRTVEADQWAEQPASRRP